MSYQPFLIANTRVGMERDVEPWLLPNDAYPQLQNCYLFRGRIKKRQGYDLLGRLQRAITAIGLNQTTTAGATTTIADILNDSKIILFTGSGTVRANLANAQVAPGSLSITISGSGVTFTDNGDGTLTSSQVLGSGTINYVTGAITLNFNPVDAGGHTITVTFNYYPNLPVMGLRTLESTTLNQESLLAFDTKFSYLFNTTTLVFNDTSFYRPNSTNFVWNGTDAQFFWTINYAGALWATNSVYGFQGQSAATTAASGDGIKWFDQDQTGWINYLPVVTGTNASPGAVYLMGCLMIFSYKGRLVVFNTTEGTSYATPKFFRQRARWSQNGTPFNTNDQSGGAAPVPTNWNGGKDSGNQAWSSDVAGKGGFIDAPTLEAIVSAEFVKDTLIVYFERSTWRLTYTGNELLPFIWEKINTELGATSTFSEVPFDKITLGVGDVGIHACDSVNVERIDQKMPDEVFNIQATNSGKQRVYGIRDYFNQLVYWTMPYVGQDGYLTKELPSPVPPAGIALTYPNRIFVYNYIDQSFSWFVDSFTCFGYYQRASDLRWQDATGKPVYFWSSAEFPWNGGGEIQQFPFIVAGNQQGFVEVLDPNSVSNDDSLYISAISGTTITSPNHNLVPNQFVQITVNSGTTPEIFKVLTVPTTNTFTIDGTPIGTFSGDGYIAVLSNINIVTKKFNPYISEAAQVRLGRTDFYFDKTTSGQLSVNLYIDEDGSIPVNSQTYSVPQVSISAITKATNAVVTVSSVSNFSIGNVVTFLGVNGMVEINELSALIIAISTGASTITIDLNTSTFTTYTNGGVLKNLSKATGNIVNTFPESTYAPSSDTTPFANTKLWKRVQFHDISQLFAIQLTMNDAQMRELPIVTSKFALHGMVLYFSKSGRLIDI